MKKMTSPYSHFVVGTVLGCINVLNQKPFEINSTNRERFGTHRLACGLGSTRQKNSWFLLTHLFWEYNNVLIKNYLKQQSLARKQTQ